MDCPRCRIPLTDNSFKDVNFEECPQCHGIWVHKQTDISQTKDQLVPDLVWMDFNIWQHEDKFTVSKHPIDCPKCGIGLVGLMYQETDVEIDFCIQCEGVWLDKGEFNKIITALTKQSETMNFNEYLRASLNEAGELITGDKNLSEEWRDFTTILRLMQYRLYAEKPAWLRSVMAGQIVSPR